MLREFYFGGKQENFWGKNYLVGSLLLILNQGDS